MSDHPAYWDTSAFAKLYVGESGSAQVRSWANTYSLRSSRLLPIEILSLLRRRLDDGTLSLAAQSTAIAQVTLDRARWTLLQITSEVLNLAETLIQPHRLRSLDAIHLASALLLVSRTGPLPFITADLRQAEAATQLSFKVLLAQ